MGYGHSVDWWTVGVLLYELCSGRSPFFDPRTIAMYERISAGSFRFPPGLSPAYVNLVSHILQVTYVAYSAVISSPSLTSSVPKLGFQADFGGNLQNFLFLTFLI